MATSNFEFGKVNSDISQLNDQKVNYSDILNVLNSTATDKALSAAQGKALNDKFGNLNLSYLRIDAGQTVNLSGAMLFVCVGRGEKFFEFFKTWANYKELVTSDVISYTISGEYSMSITNNHIVAMVGFYIKG